MAGVRRMPASLDAARRVRVSQAREGDQAAVLLHEPECAAAVAALARLGVPVEAADGAVKEGAPVPPA